MPGQAVHLDRRSRRPRGPGPTAGGSTASMRPVGRWRIRRSTTRFARLVVRLPWAALRAEEAAGRRGITPKAPLDRPTNDPNVCGILAQLPRNRVGNARVVALLPFKV